MLIVSRGTLLQLILVSVRDGKTQIRDVQAEVWYFKANRISLGMELMVSWIRCSYVRMQEISQT